MIVSHPWNLLLAVACGVLAYREWLRYSDEVEAQQQSAYEQIAEEAAKLGTRIGYQQGLIDGEKIGIRKHEEFRISPN